MSWHPHQSVLCMCAAATARPCTLPASLDNVVQHSAVHGHVCRGFEATVKAAILQTPLATAHRGLVVGLYTPSQGHQLNALWEFAPLFVLCSSNILHTVLVVWCAAYAHTALVAAVSWWAGRCQSCCSPAPWRGLLRLGILVGGLVRVGGGVSTLFVSQQHQVLVVHQRLVRGLLGGRPRTALQ